MPTASELDPYLPRQDLDNALKAVCERAMRSQWPRTGSRLAKALYLSLGHFVHEELRRTLSLVGTWSNWKDLLTEPLITNASLDIPTLRAFTSRRARQWREAVSELVDRLETDWNDIADRFHIEHDATLDSLSQPLGDIHNHGRSVYALTFSDGHAVVYKPRPVDAESIYEELLRSLGEAGCPIDLASCRVLPRREYGWTEFIPTVPCVNKAEILTYHRRQGAHLALFWRLRGSDASADNVVVSGAHPIWVDTECLFRPDLPSTSFDHDRYPDWMRESVLATGMVLGGGPPPSLRDLSGLGAPCSKERSSVLTDSGRLNSECIHQVVLGFRTMYRWLTASTISLLPHVNTSFEELGPRVRVIFRWTYIYDTLLRVLVLTPPRSLADTTEALLDVLRSGHGRMRLDEQLVRGDLSALSRDDIPYWTIATNSLSVRESAGPYVHNIARATSEHCLIQRGDMMSEDNMSKQSWLLESFLHSAR